MITKNQTATIVDIRDFGAVGDGITICTDAINRAVDHAIQTSATKVIIPPGEFVSGTVFLRSNMTLELVSGAVLKASPNIDDFPQREPIEGEVLHGDHSGRSFIRAEGCTNVTLCGGGIIDGNQDAYVVPHKRVHQPYDWFGYVKQSYQPTLSLRKCTNLNITGITIQNTVRWNVHLWQCDRVRIDGISILNHPFAGNSDGLDIDGCRDVFVSNCKIDTGDDAIVLKTLVDSRSCERITVTNCVLKSTCAAFKIGTESFHDFRHITFSNSIVHNSSRAFQIVNFDGAIVEDIAVSNIVCDTNSSVTLCRPIHIDCARRRQGYAPLGYDRKYRPGTVRRVSFSNWTISSHGRILITSADGARVEQIGLSGIAYHMPWIEDPRDVETLSDAMQSSNGSPDARIARAVIVAKGVSAFSLDGLSITYPDGAVGEDYQPLYEHGRLVRDPRKDFLPLPDMSVFWGRNLTTGRVNLSGCCPFGNGVKADIADCDIVISE